MPKTKEKKVQAGLPRFLSVDKLVPSKENKRRSITNASVQSLAKSISKGGMLQPIVVRKHPTEKGHFEIRAGERRWRAARRAGLKSIPCIVRQLDDGDALSVTIDENLEREDLHPLELALTVQQAFDRGIEKELAAKLGKSLKWLARRASLTRLAKVWQEEILKPESDGSRLSQAHLELIARLPEETQHLLAENDFELAFGHGFPSVAELARVIDGGLQSLRAMPWPLDDEALVATAGSCLNCPKRSGKQPLLFDGEETSEGEKASKSDRCLDPSCFDRKFAAHLSRRESRLREKHPDLKLVQVTHKCLSPAMSDTFGDRAVRTFEPLTRNAGPNTIPAMPIDGTKAGQLVHLSNGQLHHDTRTGVDRARNTKGKVIPLTLTERKERLQRRRDAFLVNKVGAELKLLTPQDLEKVLASPQRRKDGPAKSFNALPLLLAFGTPERADSITDASAWNEYDRFRKLVVGEQVAMSLHKVVAVWIRRLSRISSSTAEAQSADARRMCELVGIDHAAIEREASQSIPQPRSWAHLKH